MVDSPPSFSGVIGLEDAAAWMTAAEARFAQTLLDAGQAHLFAGWEAGHVEEKHAFFQQVRLREEAARALPGWDAAVSCWSCWAP